MRMCSIHGIVRDAQGRKMSKSLGNGVDPLEIIDRYGADALRFTLVNGNSPGSDMRFSEEKVDVLPQLCQQAVECRPVHSDEPAGRRFPGAVPARPSSPLRTSGCSPSITAWFRRPPTTLERFDAGRGCPASSMTSSGTSTATGTSSWPKSRLQAGGETADNARRVLVYVMTGVLQTAASVHALHHRGDLAGSAPRRGEHHGQQVA